MKLKFKTRKKTIADFDFNDALNQVFGNENKIDISDYCVLTACNFRHFIGLQFLIYSLNKQFNVKIFLIDIGLTKNQLNWCQKFDNVKIKNYLPDFTQNFYWEAWAKPFYIDQCSYNKIIWIDADSIVLNDLSLILEKAETNALFTQDYSGLNEILFNHKNLYKILKIKDFERDCLPVINTGVFVLDKKRDKQIIEDWRFCVEEAMKNKVLEESINCWDQGACKWALQKNNALECVSDNIYFNFPAHFRQKEYQPVPSNISVIFKLLKHRFTKNVIVYHWMGSPKPWQKWGEMINI